MYKENTFSNALLRQSQLAFWEQKASLNTVIQEVPLLPCLQKGDSLNKDTLSEHLSLKCSEQNYWWGKPRLMVRHFLKSTCLPLDCILLSHFFLWVEQLMLAFLQVEVDQNFCENKYIANIIDNTVYIYIIQSP